MFLSSVEEHIFLFKTNQNAGFWPNISSRREGNTPPRPRPCFLTHSNFDAPPPLLGTTGSYSFSTYLPTPTFVDVCLWVCLFIFCTISQKPLQLKLPNLTKKCSTVSPGNPFILGSHGQRSRSRGTKPVSVFRHNAILPLAACESYAGFSLLQRPAAKAILATSGFPYVARDRQTGRFFCECNFRQSASGKETLPAWVFALPWVLACSSLHCRHLHDDRSAQFVHFAEQTLEQRRFSATDGTDHGYQLAGSDL